MPGLTKYEEQNDTNHSARIHDKVFVYITLASIIGASIAAYMAWFFPFSGNTSTMKFVDIWMRWTHLNRIGSASNCENAARAYFVFALPMTVGFLGLLWKWAKRRDGRDETGLLFKSHPSFRLYHRFFLLLFCPLWIILLILGWVGFTGGNSRLIPIGDSVHALVLFGRIFPFAIAVCVLLFFGSVKKAITGKI